jgi:hypothetical protein
MKMFVRQVIQMLTIGGLRAGSHIHDDAELRGSHPDVEPRLACG